MHYIEGSAGLGSTRRVGDFGANTQLCNKLDTFWPIGRGYSQFPGKAKRAEISPYCCCNLPN